ncbi:MAG: hypothetical protein LBD08_08635 [Treponema sp.]|jgi:hypothetical protein|nr:hypothetical protein [Treponema sp.]
MNYKRILAGILGLGMCLLALSCKSSPAPAESPAAPAPDSPASPPAAQDPNGPPDRAALDELAAAKKRAEEARTLAFDFDSMIYVPEETEAAEAQYVLAETPPADTLGGVKEAAALYTMAADGFDRAFNTALPQYMRMLQNDISAARQEALIMGAGDEYPPQFDAAEALGNEAESLYEQKKDYYAAASSGITALEMYQALKTLAACRDSLWEIEEHDFREYDEENCALAEAVMQRAVIAYDGQALTEAQDLADDALLRLTQALDTAWSLYARERREAALLERDEALDVKANIAVKAEYAAAQDVYAEAEGLFFAGRYDQASDLYFQAEYLFAGTAMTAEEKQRIAGDALQAAKDKTADSEIVVRKAELILEGGSL